MNLFDPNGFGSNKGHEERVSTPKNVWAYRYFEIENGKRASLQVHCRNPRGMPKPQRGGARSRACAPLRHCRNQQPRVPYDARSDRPRHRPGARVSMCWLAARRTALPPSPITVRCPTSSCSTSGCARDGRRIGCGLRKTRSSSRVEEWLRSLWRSLKNLNDLAPEDCMFHLKCDEAHIQVWFEVGLSEQKPDGREARRVAARLNPADETLSTLTTAHFFAFSVCWNCARSWPWPLPRGSGLASARYSD